MYGYAEGVSGRIRGLKIPAVIRQFNKNSPLRALLGSSKIGKSVTQKKKSEKTAFLAVLSLTKLSNVIADNETD